MTTLEWRILILMGLAMDLHRILRRSTTVVLKSYGEPVVVLPVLGGSKVTIMARPEDEGCWYFTWGRGARIAAGPGAASYIASAVER